LREEWVWRKKEGELDNVMDLDKKREERREKRRLRNEEENNRKKKRKMKHAKKLIQRGRNQKDLRNLRR
jgi:hypothetical protein